MVLPPPARPHERHGRTRRHVQVQAAQDLVFAVVAEMHVAVAHVPAHVGFPLRSTTGAHRARGAAPWQPLHAALFAGCALRPLPPAFGHRQVHGVGRVGDVGPHGQHLHEAPEARVALLELFGEVDQLLDGRQEDADVQGVDGQVGHRQASRGHEVAAAHDGDRVQNARERRVHRMERPHEPIRALLGGHEPLVRARELLRPPRPRCRTTSPRGCRRASLAAAR